MNSEKVKEIKKVLEQNTKTCLLYDFEKNTDCKVFYCKDILDYINKLESENIQRQKLIDAYSEENERLYDDIHKKGMKGLEEQNEKNIILIDNQKARIVELESELEKEQINNLNCDTELQYKEKRIVELEKENEILRKAKTIDDNVANEMRNLLKSFAERLKDIITQPVEISYYKKPSKRGKVDKELLLTMIDETLKECLNETN